MSRLRQTAQHICESNENTSTKRFKSDNGSAVASPISATVDADAQDGDNTCIVTVEGKNVVVFGEGAVKAVKAAQQFTKDHTHGAPGALALARTPLWRLVQLLGELEKLSRQPDLERPVEACLQLLQRYGVPWGDFAYHTLFDWLAAEREGGLPPGDCAWVVSHLGRGPATLADAGSSKAGTVFSTCMLANGLLPSDRRLLFSSLVPSSNEEVERQYWDAAEQMELEEAEDEAAAPARQLQARKEYVRMLAEAHAARQGPAAEQPQLVGPPPLVQPPPRLPPLVPPRPPLPPGRGPDPVIKDEDDEQAALLHQLILLTIARICKQRVRTLLLTTPQAVRVMCGVEPSDEQMRGIAPPPPLRPEVVTCLPPDIIIIIIIIIIFYPTCCGSRYFVDEAALERVLANLPPGSSLPCNGFQARGVLAAVQHTLSLERCVQAVGEVRRALGEQPPPLEEAYAVALDRLQAIDGPHLHCMALPGGCSGDLAGLVRRALDMAPVLGTEFELGEERDQRHAKHCKLAAQPPPANQFTRAAIEQRDAAEEAFMVPRVAAALQRRRAAQLAPTAYAMPAIGAGFENALMVAGRGAMDPLHICVGDRIIAHKPKLNGELDAYEVEEVEAFLCRRTVRICQGYRLEGAKSAGSPGSFNLLVTPATGIVLGYNTSPTATAASSERTVLARAAEEARVRRQGQQMKVVLCLEGNYPDAPHDWLHRVLLEARECCAEEYRRRGQNPDDFLPTVEALRSIPVQQLAYLLGAVLGDATSRDGSMIYSASDRACGVVRDYCRLLLVLRLVPVACHDEDTSIRVRGSTASGGRRCEQSWVLGTDGEAALDAQGQRVHPQANDWDVNILVQFLVLLGAIDGSSRTLSQRFLDNLLMQSRRVLLPVVGAAADTDGWYDKQNNAVKVGQGKLCSHDGEVCGFSHGGLRCGLGGLVTVSSGSYHVSLRGARLRELRSYIKVPHKQPPLQVNKAMFRRAGLGLTYQKTDPHLRHFRAEQRDELQLCVRIRLAGGAQLVRAACGAGLLLGG